MSESTKTIVKWILGVLSFWGAAGCSVSAERGAWIGILVFLAIGSVSYYSALRWIYRKLL
jgi:hypothetical protein